MPAFSLDDDRVAIHEMARAFAGDKIVPHTLEWDEKKHFPVDVIRETAPLGMGAIYVRVDVGGSALTRFDAAVMRPTRQGFALWPSASRQTWAWE